jgi:putative ABC transport system permease protein
MFKNYFKIAWRNLLKNRASSFINIGGLAVGIAVSMLIGIWIVDELSFNKYHQHYDRIAQVMQHQTFGGDVHTDKAIAIPLATELRTKYGRDFKNVVLSSWTNSHLLSFNGNNFLKSGNFMEPGAPSLLTLQMTKGTISDLKDPSSILISESLSKSIFGNDEPIGKIITIDNKLSAKVTGIYEDLPYNTTFQNVFFIAPWDMYVSSDDEIKNASTDWGSNGYQLFVEIADRQDMLKISKEIKNAKLDKVNQEEAHTLKPEIFLQPMSRWYLHSDFINGVNTGGRIQYVWMFAIIGFFVLLLACINFMNLSTARFERRAKEVGILKALGSLRGQLIYKFLCESILVALFAFILALLLMQLILPFFNQVADKKMNILWRNPFFWLFGAGFSIVTGLIAGSYPAVFLSSFQPVKVLKGTFKVGRFATIPRKLLVVLQFTVSVILIIGTIIVFRQIQYTKNRPIGYDRDRLVLLRIHTMDLYSHFDAVRNDLLQSGLITEVSASLNPITSLGRQTSGFNWTGKTPDMNDMFAIVGVTPEFGKTVNWQIIEGRDFSRNRLTDSTGLILNEAAAKYMGLKNPVGEIVNWGKKYIVLGVIKNIIVGSPYEPVKQAIYYIDPELGGVINIKVKPNAGFKDALNTIAAVCKKYAPSSPFDYKIADEEYAKKFNEQERVGNLASAFGILAIFISCLGIFGLASFVAEQRTKEIGLRKVLGASVFNLWYLVSREFVLLVAISLLIATPLSFYFMHNWLQNYTYRTDISWWIFAVVGIGALAITLLTVSYQAIRAAIANPVTSLRSE